MSTAIVSIVCSLTLAAGVSSASAQTVPGFLVETLASVSNPLVPSMRHDGVMFVGVNPPTNQLGLVSIVRIACIGSSVTLGPAILDPDVVLVDEVGTLSGVPGSVLVAGTVGNGTFRISAWRPDGTVVMVLQHGGIDVNDLAFDRLGRLLIAADTAVYRFDGTQLVSVFQPPSRAASLANDQSGNIYVGMDNRAVAVYSEAGQLINSSFATFSSIPRIRASPGTAFGSGFVVLDNSLWQLRTDGTRTQIGTGFNTSSWICFGADQSLYVSDFFNNRVLRVACWPLICAQPQSAATCQNAFAALSLTAAGTGPFMYQWQWQPAGSNTAWAALSNGINTDNQGTPTFDVSGVTTAAVAIRSISGLLGPVGNFRCIVTNACGSVTSNEATLTICAADFNCDGDLNPDDLADYIGAYFAQPEGAGSDFNADGTTDPDDLADFIGAFFAGCG